MVELLFKWQTWSEQSAKTMITYDRVSYVSHISHHKGRGVSTELLEWLWLSFQPTFNHNYHYTHFHTTTICSWRLNLTSTITPPPIGAMIGVETKNLWILVESLFKSNRLLQILFHAWPWSSLPMPHSNYKQNETKEITYNHHNYSQLYLTISWLDKVD